MLFCVLTEMFFLPDTALKKQNKQKGNHKNTIKATHCDSIIAVVVILGLFVCIFLSLFLILSFYKKKKKTAVTR